MTRASSKQDKAPQESRTIPYPTSETQKSDNPLLVEAVETIQAIARSSVPYSPQEMNLLALLSGLQGVPFDLPSLSKDASERTGISKLKFISQMKTEAGNLQGEEWGAFLRYAYEVIGGMLGWVDEASRELDGL